MERPFKTLVVRNPFVDENDKFEELAESCVKAAVTHLTFTEIERSYWEIDDPQDPYLNWSIVHTSIFKIFPPDILSEWVPENYAAKARETVAAKAAVLKKNGLKGAAFLFDPLYWPEKVFRSHPELRGPRVDAPTQSLHPRFAPCTDHPDVLAIYRQAFKQLYELSEGVLDIIIIRSNDSATGFCWSHLYSGRNGPLNCREITHRSRINRFLNECLGDIKKNGGQTRIFLGGGTVHAGDSCHNREKFLAGLPPSCGYYSHAHANMGGENVLSGFLSNFPLYPIRGFPNPLEILEQLATAKTEGWPKIVLFTCPSMYGNDWRGNPEILKIIECFNRQPRFRLLPKMELALEAATEMYGSENAADIVEAWSNIYQASEILFKYTLALGALIFYGSMAQRWLTRPLVAFPESLSEDEKNHYKPYLFQPNPLHENPDLLDQSNKRQFDGLRHLVHFNKDLEDANGKYQVARERLAEVFKRGGKKNKEIGSQLDSFEVLSCFLLNIKNCVNFQIVLEKAKERIKASQGEEPRRSSTIRGDEFLFPMEKDTLCELIKSEIDNSLKLAYLLEQKDSLLEKADTRKKETAFLAGPDVASDLKRKAEIMLNHLTDVDELTGYR